MVKLNFVLEIKDGWPPVGLECLPCTKVKNGFRIEIPPMFIKGLSVGDIIAATPDAENQIWEWSHVWKSYRTTIWIWRIDLSTDELIHEVLQELRLLDCHTVRLETLGYFSIDVPAETSIQAVDSCLSRLNPETAAVAYPSFRHPEVE